MFSLFCVKCDLLILLLLYYYFIYFPYKALKLCFLYSFWINKYEYCASENLDAQSSILLSAEYKSNVFLMVQKISKHYTKTIPGFFFIWI